MATEVVTSKRFERQHSFADAEIDSLMTLPRSFHEAYRLHMKKIDHPSVKLFSSSLHAHRSCNEAILFLYGVSGAGKSSTLNHLFSTDLIPTSATESATDCVTEWVSSMHSETWSVSNLEVGFVDVPGWGDSEGRDATNFALIQQFLSVHPILGCKMRKHYPNIVLLIFNSNDNRMLGNEANALKMLASLSKLDIVDKKRPNVVIVLTHVCSHPREGFSEKMEEQSVIYQNISRACLGVDPPVVWMENNPKYELEIRGDWTLLYDGTEQPLNLYEAIRDLMEAARDEIGKEVMRLYFCAGNNNLPKERLVINPKLCNKKTLSKLEADSLIELRNQIPNYKSTTLNRYLRKFISSHPELNIKECDISQLLLALASVYPDLSSIDTKDVSVIESRLEPYTLSIKEKVLLTYALELQIPKLPVCIRGVGSGYDVVNESITSGLILDLAPSEKFCSFFNCPISNAFSVLPFESKRISLGTVRDGSEYWDTKIEFENMLDVMEHQPLLTMECMKSQSRTNMLNYTSDEMGGEFWIEAGIFDVQLNLPFVELSRKFCEDIDSLPNLVFTKDGKINEIFSQLFKVYGHYTIIKASGGGLIQGIIPCNKFLTRDYLLETIAPSLELYFDLIQNGYNWREIQDELSEQDVSTFTELESSELVWFRGNHSFVKNTLKEVTTEKYLSYLQSLKQSSILFDYSFSLVPIHQLVATKYPEKAKLIKQAFERILPNPDNELYSDEEHLNLNSLGNSMNILPKTPNKTSIPPAVSRFKRRTWSSRVFPKATEDQLQNTSFPKPLFSREEVTSDDKTDVTKVNTSCFSSESMLSLKNGESIRMCELRIGDSVLSLNRRTNQLVFSKVYMWGHIDHDRTASFLQIRHEHGTIKLTDNHLILHGCDKRVIKASNLQIGDLMHYFECNRDENGIKSSYTLIPTFVRSVTRCVDKGVYSPFTHNSTVVVDGVVCSVFAVPDDSVTQFCKFEKISRIVLSPFIFISVIFCGDNSKTQLLSKNKLHPYPELLLRIYNSSPTLRSYF